MLHTKPDGRELERLSDKHRAVLDLMLQHMKRKDVARQLDISLGTVDQRLSAAKKILGTRTIHDTLRTYRAFQAIYDKVLYSENTLTSDTPTGQEPVRDGDQAIFSLADAGAFARTAPWLEDQILVPRVLEGQLGSLKRIVYIVGAAIGILMVVLVGLSVAMTLNGLF